MNYLKIIEIINRHQAQNILTFDTINNRTRLLGAELPRQQNGLYWFWTSFDQNDLINCIRPTNIRGEINISRLARERNFMSKLCDQRRENFSVVYNGRGGGNSVGYGLRERILQEIKGQAGTGSVSIINSSLNVPARWRISFVNFNDPRFREETDHQINYTEHSETLEMLWRLHYGWPVLCRR